MAQRLYTHLRLPEGLERALELLLLELRLANADKGLGHIRVVSPVGPPHLNGLLALADGLVIVALLEEDGRLVGAEGHVVGVELDGLLVGTQRQVELLLHVVLVAALLGLDHTTGPTSGKHQGFAARLELPLYARLNLS